MDLSVQELDDLAKTLLALQEAAPDPTFDIRKKGEMSSIVENLYESASAGNEGAVDELMNLATHSTKRVWDLWNESGAKKTGSKVHSALKRIARKRTNIPVLHWWHNLGAAARSRFINSIELGQDLPWKKNWRNDRMNYLLLTFCNWSDEYRRDFSADPPAGVYREILRLPPLSRTSARAWARAFLKWAKTQEGMPGSSESIKFKETPVGLGTRKRRAKDRVDRRYPLSEYSDFIGATKRQVKLKKIGDLKPSAADSINPLVDRLTARLKGLLKK